MQRRQGAQLAAGLAVILVLAWFLLPGGGITVGPPGEAPAPRTGGPDSALAPVAQVPRAPGAATPVPADGPPAPGEYRDYGTPLLVRDAITRSPLAGARVYPHSPAKVREEGGPLPAWDTIETLGTSGPDGRVRVGDGDPLRLHVVAPGYRWGRPKWEGGDVVCDLQAGGAVRLVVGRWGELEEPLVYAEKGEIPEGVDPAQPAGVMVSPREAEEGGGVDGAGAQVEAVRVPEEGSVREVPGPPAGKVTVLDEGVEPGTWTYFVRRGMRDGEIYARGIVTVAAGETADLRLDAVPVTAGSRVPVRVVAAVPKAWGIDDFDVEVAQDAFIADPGIEFIINGVDPLNRHLEARGRAWKPDPDGAWRATLRPDLPAGRYRAAVVPPWWVAEVEVRVQDPEVRIELPEPGEVRVTLLDAATGKPVPNGWVRWAPSWKRLGRGQMESLSVAEATGTVVLVAPPGTCHVDAGADGYLDAERDLSFIAGSTAELKVALRPAAVLVVRLRLDGRPFEGGGRAEAKLAVDREELDRLAAESETGGVVTSQACGFRGGEARIDGLWGGPHEVTVTHLPGFEPVPPRRVEVRFGTVTEIEFDLVRAKGE